MRGQVFCIDRCIEKVGVKMQKIALFMSFSQEELPLVPSGLSKKKIEQFITQTRMYFNDKQFLIFKNPHSRQSILQTGQFQTSMSEILSEQLRNKRSYEEINFIDIVEKWLTRESLLQVCYAQFDELVRKTAQDYLLGLNREIIISSAKLNQKNKKIKNQNCNSRNNHDKVSPSQEILKTKKSKKKLIKNSNLNKLNSNLVQESACNKNDCSSFLSNKNSPKSTKTKLPLQSQQPTDSFNYYLQKFYCHYAKKAPNTNQTQDFEKLQHFYTTINLNKFMLYCKEIGILNINKTITINFIKKLFINNQDQSKVIKFQTFAKLVHQILQKVYKDENKIKQEGYPKIGVKDRKNFVQIMAKIGVQVPLKKIIFAKVENKNQPQVNLQLLEKLKQTEKKQAQSKRQKENYSLNKLSKQKKSQLFNGGYSNQLKPKKNQKQITKSSSFGTLPTLYSNQPPMQDKLLQQLLQLDVEDQDDPYLQRFKDQQKRYQHQQQQQRQKYQPQMNSQRKDKNNWGKGVIQRMDRRIQNVVKKVR